MKLTSDEIYEAALDDGLFAQLPTRIAQSVGARSCVLHWRHTNGAAEISAHSGYFTDAHMADYASNYVEHDLWTLAGARDGRLNREIRTTELVASTEYERSIFYNEWIRGMGDDTFFCMGGVLQTPHGFGIIGLHRGRAQGDFSDRALSELSRHGSHLRRMFAIRGRISDVAQKRDLFSELFEAAGEPAFAVTASGRLLAANSAGEQFLSGETLLRVRNGHVRPTGAGCAAYEQAVAAGCLASDRRASDCILGRGSRSPVMASVVPLMSLLPTSAVLVTVHGRRRKPPPELVSGYLQEAFGLSAAEADVALRLSRGQTSEEIAEARRSSPATVRTQIKHLLLKMEVRRQIDVVRMINEVADHVERRPGDRADPALSG